MVMSKTVCHCIEPFRKRKRGLDGLSPLNEAHQSEIRSNIVAYLKEDLCAPGAQSSDRNVFVVNLTTKTLATKINDIWEMSNNIPSKIDVDRFHEQLDHLMKMNYLVIKLAHNP